MVIFHSYVSLPEGIYVYGYSETGIELQLVLFRISVVNAGNSLAVDLPCPINISSTSFFLMISYVDKWGNGRGQIFASLVRRCCRIRLGSSCVAVEICAHPVVSDFRHLEPPRCNSQKANYAVPMAPLETHGFRWGFKIQSPVCAGWTYVNIQIAWIYDDSWMFIPPEIWYCRFWLSKLIMMSWVMSNKPKGKACTLRLARVCQDCLKLPRPAHKSASVYPVYPLSNMRFPFSREW